MLTNFNVYFVLQDLRSFNLERKKKGGGFEDHQQPELGTGCSSLSPRFRCSKAFKQWRNSSIKHLPCVSNITMSETKDITENPALCDLYNFRSSLINFSLSDLKNATNNFSKSMFLSLVLSSMASLVFFFG